MKKLFGIFICLCITMGATAQKQEGIVRTVERPGKPSTGLQGVTINVLEYPNAIVSQKGGKFSFTIPGKHQGESYTISRVQKKGYTLVDKQVKGRRYAYSSSVPLEIVMIPDQQLENEKKRIEDIGYNRAQKDYSQKLAVIEKQLNEKTISEREYREKYEELNKNYNNYIQRIDEMAERYATTDYKGMSELNRQIQECIENADLERADSLINSKGDFEKREQELKSKLEFVEKTEKLTQKAQEDYQAELKDLVNDYLNKCAILAADYRNDSAAYYLERLVSISPNDVGIISTTASFIENYLADYPRALEYFQSGLTQAQEQFGENNEWTGYFCGKIGLTYDYLGDQDKALEWQHKALDIYEKMEEPDSSLISMSYTLIGRAYYGQRDYDNALKYTLKGLEIRENTLDTLNLPQSYNNLGTFYCTMGSFEKSLEYHMKALDLRERIFGDDSDMAAFSCMNIAYVYHYMGDYDKALEYDLRALDIYQRVMGPAHPFTIDVLTSIGNIYNDQNDLDKALEYYQQALKGSEQYHGKEHSDTYSLRIKMATVFYKAGNREQAVQELQEIVHKYDADSEPLAQTYLFIGNELGKANVNDEALQYLMMAQDIYKNTAVENFNSISAYTIPGNIYMKQGKYDQALECYQQAYEIGKRMLGEQNPYSAMFCSLVGDAFSKLGKKKEALEHYRQALDIFEHAPDKDGYEENINSIKETIKELKH